MRIIKLVLLVLAFASSSFAQWEQTTGPEGGPVSAFAVNSSNNYIFAVVDNYSAFRSTDGGATWVSLWNTLPGDLSIYTVTSSGTNTYLCGSQVSPLSQPVYYSSDYGNSWTRMASVGLPGFFVPRVLTVSGGNLVLSTASNGIFWSTDNGASWTASTGLAASADVAAFASRGSFLYGSTSAAVFTKAIYRSKDNGQTWTSANVSSFGTGYMTGVAANANGIYASTSTSGVYRSTDSGEVWTKINPGGLTNFVASIYATSSNVFVGIGTLSYKGDASGDGMVSSSTGLPPTNAGAAIMGFATSGSTVLAAAAGLGVWRSVDAGTSWAESNSGLRCAKLNGLFGTPSLVFAASEKKGFFRTSNGGDSWIEIDSGVGPYVGWFGLIETNSGALLGGSGAFNIFRSIDNGLHWTATNIANNPSGTFAFALGGGDTVYATGQGRIQISIDDGQNWSTLNSGFTFEVGLDIIKNGPHMLVTSNIGQKRSVDNGVTWTAPISGLAGAFGVAGWTLLDTVFFAAGASGVYKSLDNGANWALSNTGLTGNPQAILASAGILYVGTATGAFQSDDSGGTWTALNDGLPINQSVKELAADDTYLYGGTPGKSVWRRLLSPGTDVKEIVGGSLPTGFQVYQNYPNPFNPVTTIEFSLASRTLVTIEIYNVLGQRVRSLVNESKSAGNYRIEWGGEDDAGRTVSSGVYLYRFKAGDETQTKKMILLK